MSSKDSNGTSKLRRSQSKGPSGRRQTRSASRERGGKNSNKVNPSGSKLSTATSTNKTSGASSKKKKATQQPQPQPPQQQPPAGDSQQPPQNMSPNTLRRVYSVHNFRSGQGGRLGVSETSLLLNQQQQLQTQHKDGAETMRGRSRSPKRTPSSPRERKGRTSSSTRPTTATNKTNASSPSTSSSSASTTNNSNATGSALTNSGRSSTLRKAAVEKKAAASPSAAWDLLGVPNLVLGHGQGESQEEQGKEGGDRSLKRLSRSQSVVSKGTKDGDVRSAKWLLKNYYASQSDGSGASFFSLSDGCSSGSIDVDGVPDFLSCVEGGDAAVPPGIVVGVRPPPLTSPRRESLSSLFDGGEGSGGMLSPRGSPRASGNGTDDGPLSPRGSPALPPRDDEHSAEGNARQNRSGIRACSFDAEDLQSNRQGSDGQLLASLPDPVLERIKMKQQQQEDSNGSAAQDNVRRGSFSSNESLKLQLLESLEKGPPSPQPLSARGPATEVNPLLTASEKKHQHRRMGSDGAVSAIPVCVERRGSDAFPLSLSEESEGEHKRERGVTLLSTLDALRLDASVETYMAMYGFKAQRTGDLTLRKGDLILVRRKEGGEAASSHTNSPPSAKKGGWWHGETIDGRRGLFPSNYVEKWVGPGLPAHHWGEEQTTGRSRGNSAPAPPFSSTKDLEDGANEESESDEPEENIFDFTFDPNRFKNEEDDEVVQQNLEADGRSVQLITSGPKGKLVEVMAARTNPEPNFISAFLLTRRYFMSATALFKRLIWVYKREPGPQATPEEIEDYQKWGKIIQGRVLNVFQKWLENIFQDFMLEKYLLEALVLWVRQECHESPLAKKLIKTVRKKKREFRFSLSDAERERKLEENINFVLGNADTNKKKEDKTEGHANNTEVEISEGGDTTLAVVTEINNGTEVAVTNQSITNCPVVPKKKKHKKHFSDLMTLKILDLKDEKDKDKDKDKDKEESVRHRQSFVDQVRITFLKISPEELASQLTIIEQSIFRDISPLELLFGGWKKANKKELTPNIVRLIDWFNKITRWVASEVVTSSNLKLRIRVLTRFIQTAEECVKLQNYNATNEIISALQLTCVSRLKQTWRGLKATDLATFTRLSELMSREDNYRNYRESLSLAATPRLPYIGLHLADILSLLEISTWVPSPKDASKKHVNFQKMRNIERAAKPILSCYTNPPYEIKTIYNIQRFLMQDLITLDEAKLFEASKACEPSK